MWCIHYDKPYATQGERSNVFRVLATCEADARDSFAKLYPRGTIRNIKHT